MPPRSDLARANAIFRQNGLNKQYLQSCTKYLDDYLEQTIASTIETRHAMMAAKARELLNATKTMAREVQQAQEQELFNHIMFMPESIPQWLPSRLQAWMARVVHQPVPFIVGVINILDQNLHWLSTGMQGQWCPYPALPFDSAEQKSQASAGRSRRITQSSSAPSLLLSPSSTCHFLNWPHTGRKWALLKSIHKGLARK